MIIYENTIQRLIELKGQVELFINIEKSYKEKLGMRPGSGEFTSWIKSIPEIIEVLEKTTVPRDVKVLIEYSIPFAGQRIDVIVCGKDQKGNKHAIVIELKQWENVAKSDIKGMVKTSVADKSRMLHPSLQVSEYVNSILNIDKNFADNKISLEPVVFMHNYEYKGGIGIFDPIYNYLLSIAPVFSKDKNQEFVDLLNEKIGGGTSDVVYEAFKNMDWKPSDSLISRATKFGNKLDDVFNNITLYFDQATFFDVITKQLKDNSDKKNIFVINGYPGSGKTFLAMKLYLYYAFNEKKRTALMLPGADFRNSIKEIFGLDRKENINIFGSNLKGKPTNHNSKIKKDEYDILIVDEAHKLTEKASMSNVEPFKNIINNPHNSLLFVDDYQVVDKGSYDELDKIRNIKRKNTNVIELNLQGQYRSNGGTKYIEWLQNILFGNNERFNLVNSDIFKFNILETPDELLQSHKSFYKNNKSSRLLATGTSFEWTKKVDKNGSFKDVSIGSKNFSWYPAIAGNSTNRKNTINFNELSAKDKKQYLFNYNTNNDMAYKYIGYDNTVQGSEFESISLYVGDEFFLNKDLEIDFDLSLASKNSRKRFWSLNQLIDKPKKKDELFKKQKINRDLALNQLYILLTRSRKEVNVYFKNKDIREHVKQFIESSDS